MSDPSTEAALREISRVIGGLQSTVTTLVTTWQSQEASATQGRRDLHQKFDALRDDLHEMRNKVSGALDDIAEIKPSVQAFEIAKQRVVGAQMLGKIIWGLIFASGGGIGWMIANWISTTPKFPPH